MKALELYYTPEETSVLVKLHVKTVREKLIAGEFGRDVVNLGSDQRPDYRIPASGVNAYLHGRRLFSEPSEDMGIPARSIGELRRKARDRE